MQADPHLRALRDCHVIRAAATHTGYARLVAQGFATTTRRYVDGVWKLDYRLTDAGRRAAGQ